MPSRDLQLTQTGQQALANPLQRTHHFLFQPCQRPLCRAARRTEPVRNPFDLFGNTVVTPCSTQFLVCMLSCSERAIRRLLVRSQPVGLLLSPLPFRVNSTGAALMDVVFRIARTHEHDSTRTQP